MSAFRKATSTADRAVVCDVVRAAFEVDEAPLVHRAQRLASARRATADTWVVEEGGRIVSSLLSYPLRLGTPDGRVVPGYGLGAVSTLPGHRGHGHALGLCAHVAAQEEAAGRPIGLLFSMLPTEVYGRVGFRALPAWEHACERLEELAASGPRADWQALDPRRARPELARLYDAAHAGTLHLARDAEDWERTLQVRPDDWWVGLGDPDGTLTGSARLRRFGDVLSVVELALDDPADEPAAWRGLAAIARELGRERIVTWLPPSPTVQAWCTDEGREHTLPMARGYAGDAPARFWPSDYF